MKRLFFSMLLVPGVSFADHICTNSPGEVYVGNTPAGQGQASMPVCRWAGSSDAPPSVNADKRPLIVIDRWHVVDDRFSSFAIDAERGPFGFVSGYESQAEADEAALDQCQSRTGEDCLVLGQFKNRCATFAWGGGRYAVMGGGSIEESEVAAVRKCAKEGGVDCQVIQSVCSEPVYRVVDEKPHDFVEAD